MTRRMNLRLGVGAAMICLAVGAPMAGRTASNPKKARSPVRRTPSPTVPANRDPIWPQPVKVEATTTNKYDAERPNWLLGATTIITVLTPASDPDGDPITYTWNGAGVGLTTTGPKQFEIKEGELKGDGLSATWWRQSWSGEPASGILTVTANDGKGGQATHLICLGRYVQCP